MSEIKSTAIKLLGDRRIGGYGILFGDPEHTDLERDFFNEHTDFWLDTLPTVAYLFDHAMTPLPEDVKAIMQQYPELTNRAAIWDKAIDLAAKRDKKRYKVGSVVERKMDADGIWFECILDEHNEYANYVLDLVKMGVLGYSTDSIPHLVDREPADNGSQWVKSWPLPFISGTHRPAEPRNLITTVKHYLSPEEIEVLVGDNAALKALLEAGRTTVTTPLSNTSMEKPTMLSIKSNDARLTLAKALVRDSWDTLANVDFKALSVKAMDEEDTVEEADKAVDSELTALVMPLAEQFAATFGGSVEEAMALLMAAGVEIQQRGAGGELLPEAEGMTEEEMMSLPAKSYNPAALRSALGGAFKVKNVNINLNTPDNGPQFARFIKALARPQDPKNAAFLHSYHSKAAQAWKAQGGVTDSAGGYLTTPEKNGEIIENLRAEAVVAGMVRQYPMSSSKLVIPRLDTGIAAGNTAENAQIPEDQADFGNLEAPAVKIAVMVKISNELMEDSDPDVEQVLTQDITRAVAEKVDTQILRGTGLGSQLLGLDSRAGITSTAIGGGSLAYTDMTQCQERLEDANVRITDRVQWLIDPKGKRILREVEDRSKRLIFTGGSEGQQMSGRIPDYILDYTWKMSNLLVPSGTSARKIYLAQWEDIVLGMRKQIEFLSSNQAGTAFEYDQTWIRAIVRCALIVRHDESVQILTGITSAEQH